MCGVFSWSGIKPGVFNRDKFDKLGILNETRGKHSCGIAIDGDIYLGIGENKIYTDFIANNNDIEDPKRYPVVLGHTRHATVGAHTIDNAHPFGFGTTRGDNNQIDYAFIGVHNGSLLNHIELAKKYNIDLESKSSEGNYMRKKIDSEILLEILYRTKNFKVLSEYYGAAALKWCFLNEPDVVYYYHGKSYLHQNSAYPTEERSLWFYRENKNSLYASSIPKPLETIGAVEDTLGEFDYNTVYKVTNGDIDNAVKYKISRHDKYQKGVAPNKDKNSKEKSANTNKNTGATSKGNKSQSCKVGQQSKMDFKESMNIYDETPVHDANAYGGKVYMHKFRYWRNGHRIKGFWTYIEGFGFYELGQTIKDAEHTFKTLLGKLFIKGEFKSIDQVEDDELNMGWIPFKEDDKASVGKAPLETFYDGIRIESPRDLVGCMNMEENGRGFDVKVLSMVAKHPVIDLDFAKRGPNDQEIFMLGDLCSDVVAPLGAERVYEIKEGNLVACEELEEMSEVTDLIEAVEKLEKSEDRLEEGAKTPGNFLQESTASGKSGGYVDDDFMENFLRRVFETPVTNLKNHKKQLAQYLPNLQANRAIRLIESFDNSVNNLLEVEEKE